MRRAGLLLLLGLLVSPAARAAQVRLGVDRLEENDWQLLKGARVALITNQTGVDSQGRSTVDLLRRAPGVTLKCVMSPEHGFEGTIEHGRAVADRSLGALTVYGLYGKNERPTDEMLAGVDTVVFDVQDIGVRFYTYITTMGMALEECAKRKLRFIVLDRPNPLRGDIIEGDLLDADIKRMTGYFRIPVRYGLTMGELARWMNDTRNLGANLVVVKMRGWKRSMWYDGTGLRFRPPSPNIPRLASAFLYPGIGCFEATNMAVGRGTDTPFEIFGAPWLNAAALCAYLRTLDLPGLVFDEVEFTPTKDVYAGDICRGVRITVTDRNRARPFDIFVASVLFLSGHQPDAFHPDWEEVRVVTGSRRLENAVRTREPLDSLRRAYREAADAFLKETAPAHLY